jgi:hypothetical protein
VFGRRRQGRHASDGAGPGVVAPYEPELQEEDLDPPTGPFDVDDVPDDGIPRLDLGSVRVPVPEGAQLQVEVDQSGPVRAVHLLIPQGQFTISAFAAPRSARLWNEVRREIITQLEAGGARVRESNGDWGREVIAIRPDLVLHFIGVNGPRWLLRGVAAGSADNAPALVEQLRQLLRSTVVVRGDEPMPVRAALPLTLPEPLAEQLKQAARGA